MEKDIVITMLYDIYGKLLTEKQRAIFEEYYLYNLSLREIAENKAISYQAVRDSIKSSEKMLIFFEETIHMNALNEKIDKVCTLLKCEELENAKDKILLLLKSEDDI